MPLFYFHLQDGQTLSIDDEGVELPSYQQARIEAVAAAGAFLADKAKLREISEDWAMDVTDAMGLPLFRIVFRMEILAPEAQLLSPIGGE